MRNILIICASALIATTAFAFGEPKHSKVEVTQATEGDKLSFTFKVLANENMAITLDAPWKLELKNHEGLALAKTSLNKADMNESLPGYVVTTTAKPAGDKGELEYSLTAFICTKDKSQCYREVHKGKHAWTKG